MGVKCERLDLEDTERYPAEQQQASMNRDTLPLCMDTIAAENSNTATRGRSEDRASKAEQVSATVSPDSPAPEAWKGVLSGYARRKSTAGSW